MKLRALAFAFLSTGVLLSSAGCSELAGSGELVTIPAQKEEQRKYNKKYPLLDR